jgi:ketosteroid isomerase-like protein
MESGTPVVARYCAAMSQQNIELVERIYEEVSARAWQAPTELFGPDYAIDLTDAAPDLGVIAGVEAAEGALREYTDTFEDFRVELLEVLYADKDCVVTAVRDGGRLKGGDAEVWNHFFHVWTFRNGKIARRSSHRDRERALKAAGVKK